MLYLSDDERLHVREIFNSTDATLLLFRPKLMGEKKLHIFQIFSISCGLEKKKKKKI